jgi:hypothetical protein
MLPGLRIILSFKVINWNIRPHHQFILHKTQMLIMPSTALKSINSLQLNNELKPSIRSLRKRSALTFLLIIFLLSSSFAQRNKQQMDTSAYLEQPNRIEFNFERSDLAFSVINGYEDGLLVVKETNVRKDGGFEWGLYKLDTALQIEWSKSLIVPYEYSLEGWDYSLGKFYMLYSTKQYSLNEFAIFSLTAENGQFAEYPFSTVFPVFLSHFEVLKETILIAGRVNYKTAVLTLDLKDLKPKVIPGIYRDNSQLLEIYGDDRLGVFSIAMMERMLDKRFGVSIKTFTTENQLIQNHQVFPSGRTSIIDGAPTQFSTGFQYVAGAYSLRSPEYSRGLYLSRFANGQQQFLKYYNYAELSNFFGYMGSRREQRVQDRIEKRNVKGKKNRFNYRLLMHDIIQRDDHFLLIGEAYYPRYSTYQTAPNQFGATLSTVIGYKYTHAIVVAFDKEGNILWDQSFPIEDVFKDQLTETVQVIAKKDRVELHYLEENTIRSKVVIGNEVFEGESFTPVRLTSDKDQNLLKDPEFEGLERWYGGNLFAYGEQQLVHQVTERVKAKRDIFYINKVYYNTDDIAQ